MIKKKIVVLSLALRVFAGGFSFAREVVPVNPPADASAADGGRRSRTQRLMAITGDSEFADDRAAWDKTYNRKDYVYGKDPVPLLVQNLNRLPVGRALDLAAGEGRNSVYLAKKGFQVDAVDISSVGLRKAQKLAAENGVKIKAVNADLTKYHIEPDSYSVIVNFFYLQRNLFSQMAAGLRPGGMLVFESHTTAQLHNPTGKDYEEEYLLRPGELGKAFPSLETLIYEEKNDGRNAVARLVARKK